MTIALSGAPFEVTYRELWLPPGIRNNATLPNSVEGGHPLTLTGAQKRTTYDGVRGTGAATSNINCGVIHSNIPKLWVSVRFRLDVPHAAGSGDRYLWGKRIDGDDLICLYLDNNGMLHFYMRTGAVDRFTLLSTITSWAAGVWYHSIASLSDTAGGIQRLIVNGNLEDSDVQAAANTPNGGDLTLLDLDDPGFGNGLRGVEADVFIGIDDLTGVEETDLYLGIPPANVVNEYLLDEGRVVTAYDRGSGGNNGTLDTEATWAWGQVQQPVLSFDAHNDIAQSAAAVDISGAFTAIWAGKLKAHYDGLSDDHYFVEYQVDANNGFYLRSNLITGDITLLVIGSGDFANIRLHGFVQEIDDYAIFIATLTAGGVASLYANGELHDRDIGVGARPAGGAVAYLGAEDSPAFYDISKPLLVALADGAFTQRQVTAYSRYLKNIFNLPVAI